MWLDGKPYWSGIQIDETAFPILLADQLRRANQLGQINPWPMIRLASEFILKNGPVTSQDRWEEDGGYSPFTLAVEIAALLAAADFATENGEKNMAEYLQETADSWNSMIERWTYVGDNETARKFGIDGYYIRIAPPDEAESSSPATGFVPIKNRPPGQSYGKATHIISPDALALVRFGLRSAADKRITDTVRIIDAMLRTDVKTGVVWHRYNGDGYGEHRDGKPFNGTGIGRGWPLLAGERAHYEIARGNLEAAEFLRRVIENQTSDGMMIPEQVWDSDDIPKMGLYNGKPSGSAMPLVWAHAEYLKLLRSLNDGKIFDMPPQPVLRYQKISTTSRIFIWKFNNKCRELPWGSILRIEVQKPAVIHWSSDNWASFKDDETIDTGLGVYHLDLDTKAMKSGGTITFTFKWSDTGTWEGHDFQVTLGE
jgi:glucoamylase